MDYFKALSSNLAEETNQNGQTLFQIGNPAKWFSKSWSSEHEVGVLTIRHGQTKSSKFFIHAIYVWLDKIKYSF